MPNASAAILIVATCVLAAGLMLALYFSIITSLSGGSVNMPMVNLGVVLSICGIILYTVGILVGRVENR